MEERPSYPRLLQVSSALLDHKLSESGLLKGNRQTFAEQEISLVQIKHDTFKINTKHFATSLIFFLEPEVHSQAITQSLLPKIILPRPPTHHLDMLISSDHVIPASPESR